MVFASEMVGWGYALSMQPFTDRFKAYRKILKPYFGSERVALQYAPLQEVEAHRLLWRILKDQDNITQHIQTEAGAVILRITYYYRVEPHREDRMVNLVNVALEQFSLASTPGTWLVDIIPALKYVPAWFPGAGFKRTAQEWRRSLEDVAKKPYALVQKRIEGVPMGVPHMSTADDMYDGYYIPKGSRLMPNIWGMLHDPVVYQDPLAFKPERFLENDGREPETDPHNFVFGFGRRVCPGRILADTTVWVSVAKCLAGFKISKPVESGVEVDVKAEFQPGVISHPVPCKLQVVPRSASHEALLLAVEQEHPWEQGDGSELDKIRF
ncbi:hypothetical protein N7490_000215 [Penicillium lividum]|nr:hypothetical protein N7490_000215 [Penicillium lividum]